MKRSSSNLIVSLLVWIIFPLAVTNVSGYQIFVHNETQPFPTIPRIWQLIAYDDGTAVARIIRRDPNINSTSTTTTFTDQRLSLRIIYPNGTVSEIDKDLEIQSFNYNITLAAPDVLDPINIRVLQAGYVLVTYFNASNVKDYSTYEEWGLVIGWDGTIYSRKKFGFAYIDSATGLWNPSVTTTVTNIDPTKGFLRISGVRKTFDIEWQQYFMDNNFQLNILSSGVIVNSVSTFGGKLVAAIATVDEGYAIISANSTNSETTDVTPLTVRAGVYAFTKAYSDRQFSSEILLYQSPVANLNFTSLICAVSRVGVGELCSITIQQANTTYYAKLNFLSSGSVTEFTPISRQLPNSTNITTIEWQLETLPYGGYWLFSFTQLTSGVNVYGYVYDDYSFAPTQWELPEPTITNLRGTHVILPNNTLLLSLPESNNFWSLVSTELPKFTGSRDHGYFNVQVNTTNPAISSEISTSTDNITITYYDPVILSAGNVSIHQVEPNGNNNLRQIVSGTMNAFCSVSDDGLTVTIKTIGSTFSRSGVQYYVQVDNNFVQSGTYKESLIGIRANIWNFRTKPSEKSFAGSVTGLLRLTLEGTTHFNSLDNDGKKQFFSNLLMELSNTLSVSPNRLSSNERTQVDFSISPGTQMFISLSIASTKDENERSVSDLVKDLNTMISNKDVTPIGLNPTTQYLDAAYGFSPSVDLWEKYKLKLLGVFLAIALFVILFILAQRRESKGRNLAILQLGVIIFDLVFDILFVSNNGKDVEELYIPR